ncbi:chromosomal replication initiator protein DnaA, partial [Patescibacteria group bacterium]
MNIEEIWQKALAELELEVSRATFATWFQNTSLNNVDDGMAIVFVPNAFAKEWLQKKYHKCIVRALRNHCDLVKSVDYRVVSPESIGIIQPQSKRPKQKEPKEEQLEFKDFSSDPQTNLNPKYTFDNFIVGSFNELAHAAALSVTKNLGRLYNPFFIYGGVGLGKTHLLQAIGHEAKKENPQLKVLYITSEKFANELISLIQNREPLQLFKEKYRNVDLLIIDDVQFIAGKSKTEEELFHTYNTLYYEQGKQIIFSADRPPQAILNLEQRLKSRFESGLIADIAEPEYEARLAILKSKSEEREYMPNDEILEYVASIIQKNIRELEGALNILIAKARLKSKPISIEEAKDAIEQLISRSKKIVSMQQIIQTVSSFYDLDKKELFERSRRREIVYPRQIAMFLLREDFHASFPNIGQKFGGRDHTTAIHAYEKIAR